MIATEALSIEAIRRQLRTSVVGRHLYLFEEVESTNTVLSNLARSGAEEGTVVVAESQRRGRGRLGQEWFSPGGVNLHASVLFREPLMPRRAGAFTFIAGLALTDSIKDLGLHPAIKWPNDVLLNSRKVGGSLVECAIRDETVEFLVLGVGVNLNVSPQSLRDALGAAATTATSVSEALGHDIDRNAFAASYLNHLDRWALCHRQGGTARILEAWRDRDILTGRRITARGADASYDGRVLGVSDEGQLVVQDSLGGRHVILTEEIQLLD
ncbi:MAG TPA: biotin--[acetyl-CoA-carboxylase] ligase [Candidatus Methylomirabilis sp.]|nr:biotin--[acetyl-CoA-carboxylase] ligase [Candidatus Methylomirabilis sp.]